MYNNKLVVAVKTNGKVLREDKDTVFLPFGSEYSLLLKNLNSVRALLSIEIDGTNVLDGEKLVINANGEIDLQRFMKNGNKDQGNRFKFIERTAGIEQHRGVGAIDGIVRVTFQFEKRKALPVPEKVIEHHYHYDYWGPRYFARYPLLGGITYGSAKSFDGDSYGMLSNATQATLTSTSISGATSKLSAEVATASNAAAKESMMMNVSSNAASPLRSRSLAKAAEAPANDVGITVAGSISEQKFQTVDEFEVETEEHVIILNLKGQTETAKVEKAVTVQTKLKCGTCGTVNKSNSKFCRQCGTSLHVV